MDKIDLFITGNDGTFYSSWWTNPGRDWSGYHGWSNIGGIFPNGAPITQVQRHPDNIDLFICGNDGHVYTAWWHSGQEWSGLNGWRDIGGTFPPGARVTAVSRHSGHIELVICGNNGRVYVAWWYAGNDWSGLGGWRDIGGTFPAGAPVTALSKAPNSIDLFITGNDGHVYTSWWYEGSDWSGLNGWRGIGGTFPPGAPVSASSRHPSVIDLFICGNNGFVYTSWWHEGHDWSGLGGWKGIGGQFPRGCQVTAVNRVVEAVPPTGDPIKLHADVHTDDAVPVGGWADLEIHPDGTFTFTGHFHDSGFPSYDTKFVWLVGTDDGVVFGFMDEGEVHGTLSSDSRDHDWVRRGCNAGIRDLWAKVRSGRNNWRADFDIDLGDVFGAVLLALAYTGAALAFISGSGGGRNRYISRDHPGNLPDGGEE